jgi:type IV pilus assembly protein PilQ
MKATLAVLATLALLATAPPGARAQAETPNPPPADTGAAPPTPEAATPAPPAEAAAPAAAAPAAPGQSAPAESTAPATEAATNAEPAQAEPPAESAAPVAAESASGLTTATAPHAVIPLIQFQDVELTVAIENLALQAGLNYILDPKVAFGRTGPDGKPVPQPKISLRWENLTAEQALMALLSTYNLQLIEDPKTKVARITVKDPAAPPPLLHKIIQLKYAGPSNVLASVQSALTDKRSKVVPDLRTSQLVVVATEPEITAIEEMLARLDTPTKQVLIEAKILETTVNPKTIKGIDWSGTLTKQNVTFGNGITTGTTTTTRPGTPTSVTLPGGRVITTTPGSSSQTVLQSVLGNGGVSYNTWSGFSPATAFLNADGLSVALSFLNSSADTRTISEPRVVTLDNQKATIDVGLMFPIVNISPGTANTPGGSSITYSNLTVNLDVTPRITADDYIEMKVVQGILRLGPKFVTKVADAENQVDSFFTRKIETAVLIPSGNTLVMGGLISDESLNSNVKVPLLGDMPVLGYAFRKDSKERNRQNLIVFITPTIVKDNDFQPAQSTFLKSTGDSEAHEEWSAWDSGKPYDWSRPKKKQAAAFQPVPPAQP